MLSETWIILKYQKYSTLEMIENNHWGYSGIPQEYYFSQEKAR